MAITDAAAVAAAVTTSSMAHSRKDPSDKRATEAAVAVTRMEVATRAEVTRTDQVVVVAVDSVIETLVVVAVKEARVHSPMDIRASTKATQIHSPTFLNHSF